MLVLMAGWALFVFAGAYRPTIVPIILAAAVVTARYPPRFARGHRVVDVALLAGLAVVAVQLIPLPPTVRQALEPASPAVDQALFLEDPGGSGAGRPARPLTLDPAATAWALAFGAATLLIFWAARTTFERRGGLRSVSRGIIWCGLVVSAITFVQHALTPRLIYGFWRPITQTSVPLPYGPFVNRNDLAAWLILALPVAVGYAMARLSSRTGAKDGRIDIERILDARMVWLAASGCLMLALLLASTSRSGIVGAAFGLVTLVILGRRRLPGAQFALLLAGLLLVAIAAASYASIPALTARFGDVLNDDLGRGRVTIWRNSWPMAQDFWRTGLGVGAFGRGMLVYQETPRLLFFNHAHNQYLQILVEGGVPLAMAAGAALFAGWRGIHRRLGAERTSVFWIRAGAASGIAGILVQSLWDAGLRMPANAVLFAIVAAMAIHEPGEAAASRDTHPS